MYIFKKNSHKPFNLPTSFKIKKFSLSGDAEVPGDKSISQRALIIGLASIKETVIKGILDSEDVFHTLKAIEALGAKVEVNKNNKTLISNERIVYFLLGITLSLALGLRANILPAFLIMVIFIFLTLSKSKEYLSIAYFGMGLSPSLIMPLHNFIFTKKFIPLTIAAYKDWNLGAKPVDYLMLIISFFKLNIDLNLWKKISSHVSGELKLYEVWYHISIFINIYVALNRNSNIIIRLISWTSISMLVLILFYHVGGRYSYLTWTLCLIVLACWIKNNLFPFLEKIKNQYAS